MLNLDKEALGMRIFEIRKEKGLTLEEFGKMVDGAGKSTVSKWERGLTVPNSKRLKIITKLGKLSVFRLLYGSGMNYLFDNIEKLLPDEGKELASVMHMDHIEMLGEAIENSIVSPTDFEGIKRVISQEYLKIKKDIIDYNKNRLQPISAHKNLKGPQKFKR